MWNPLFLFQVEVLWENRSSQLLDYHWAPGARAEMISRFGRRESVQWQVKPHTRHRMKAQKQWVNRVSCSLKSGVIKQMCREKQKTENGGVERETWEMGRRMARASGTFHSYKIIGLLFFKTLHLTTCVTLSKTLLFPTNTAPRPGSLHPVSALKSPEEIIKISMPGAHLQEFLFNWSAVTPELWDFFKFSRWF